MMQRTEVSPELVDELKCDRTGQPISAITPSTLSSDHYRLLYEHTPSMSFALDANGTVVSVNHFGAEQLGYSPDDLTGQSILLVFDQADHQTVRNQLIICAENIGKTFQWEIEKVHKSGRRVWVRETARAVRNHEGRLIILVLCEDVTARKLEDERNRSITNRLKVIVQTSPLAIMALDEFGENVTLWNQAAEQMFGWSEQEVLGKPVPFLTPDLTDESDQLWSQLLEHGQLQGVELRRKRRDGTPLALSLWATVLRDQEGNIENTFGLIADITEQKKLETAIRLNEQAIRQLHEITSRTTAAFDEQVRALLDLGRRRFQLPIAIFTTAQGEDLELTAIRSDVPMPSEGTRLNLRDSYCFETLLAEEPIAIEHIGQSEWKHLRAYSQFRFESYIGAKLSVQGKAVGSISFLSPLPYPATFTDLDKGFLQLMARWLSSELERLQAESALRASEERFRLIFNNAPIGMCLLNRDKTLRKVNPAFQRLIGYSEEEILGNGYVLYTHPDDITGNLLLTDKCFRGEIPGYSLEKRYITKDGRTLWVHVTTSSLDLPGEPEKLLLAIAEDISLRKEAEQELTLIRERLQFLLSANPSVIYSCKATDDYGATYISDNIVAQMGYQPSEFTEDPGFWSAHIHREDRSRVFAELRNLFIHGTHVHEYRFLHKDGSYRWVHDRLMLIRNPSGIPLEIVGSWIDITERKRTEEALRSSEERFSKAFRSSPHPIVVTELATGRVIEVNDASLQLFGFRREEVIGQNTLALGIWPSPESRQRFFDELTSGGSLHNLDLTFYTKDRALRRCLISCETIELNGVRCVVTVGTDITEQTRAIEALRQSEMAVRLAFEERERLSQDLHDNLLQSLYAVGMGLEVTKRKILRISRENAKRLETSVTQLNGVIREVREFIPRMTPPTRKTEGVAEGLRSLSHSFASSGTGCITASIDERASRHLSHEQGMQVLAIAKEALSNSVRHSNATKRVLSFSQDQRWIRLKIEDNGTGFTVNKRRSQGMGIKNMRARARKLGAKLSIASARGKGTRTTLLIPIENASINGLPTVPSSGGSI